jgi:group I intron endonuclease
MITYVALDLKSKKFYIGSTSTSLEERIKGHKKEKNYPFQRALNKREEDFFWLWCEDESDGREEEQFFIDFYFGSPWCYNLSPMASVPPSSKGRKNTEEHNRKISESKVGKRRPDVSERNKSGNGPRRLSPISEAEKQRLREQAKKPRSEDYRKKLSAAKVGRLGYTDGDNYKMFYPGTEPEGWVRGKPAHYWRPSGVIMSDETKEALRDRMNGNSHWEGKKHTEETKEKIRQANLGRAFSEEHRAKISQSKLGNKNCVGRKISEETREKMRQSALLREKRKREQGR